VDRATLVDPAGGDRGPVSGIRFGPSPAAREARARDDGDRLRSLVHDGALAARRADRALARDPTADLPWLGRQLDEALALLHRARNRALLSRADVTATVDLA
jgi:hypothetical protein